LPQRGEEIACKIQHAQKSTELTGGLWRVAVLEMGHLVTEEGDLGYSEDALRRVDDDPIPMELGEESS
jgi:hypothetical protein